VVAMAGPLSAARFRVGRLPPQTRVSTCCSAALLCLQNAMQAHAGPIVTLHLRG
jgi:hypothetical protein